MTDKPAVESFSKDEVSEKIINNEEVRDTEAGSNSSFNAFDDEAKEYLPLRTLGRKQAIEYIDDIISEKITKSIDFDHIDEELNKISQQRQLEREAFMAGKKVNKRRIKKKVSKRSTEAAEIAAAITDEARIETTIEAKLQNTVNESETETPVTEEVSDIISEQEVETSAEENQVITEAAEIENKILDSECPAMIPEQQAEITDYDIQEAAVAEQTEISAYDIQETAEEEKLQSGKLDAFIDGIFAWYHNKVNNISNAAKSVRRGIANSIRRRESRISGYLAETVERLDAKYDKTADKVTGFFRLCALKWRLSREWAENHKRLLLTAFSGVAVMAAFGAILIGNLTAYEYMYNGKVLGTVKDKQDVYKTIDIIGDKLSYVYGAEIEINKEEDITFKKVYGWYQDIDDKDDVLNTFTYLRDMNANAYAICVDGKQIAVLNSESDAEDILNSIKDKFLQKSESIEYKSVDFAEEVQIKEINTKIGNIDDEEKVLEYMLTGSVEKRIHVVEQGDTFSQIAKDYGLKDSELQLSNPGVTPDRLKIGQELVLTQVCPVLTVQTVEVATYIDDIDYDITYQETSTLYQGEQTVKSYGIPGERQVVAEIVRNNGIEVSRNELSSEVLKEPKSQVVLKGTKEIPPLIGTGKFIYPTRGKLTSRFGPRWGRMHYGIDLAAPTGTKIRASDGGKVVYAGWDGSYGYVVRIDHGGNRVTVYAHCSKLLVKKGDKVYQDQHIANVGNTGRSTGPHLHFEVRINGKPQNPLKYLN